MEERIVKASEGLKVVYRIDDITIRPLGTKRKAIGSKRNSTYAKAGKHESSWLICKYHRQIHVS